MNKSRIEWLSGGYSINPIKGKCPVGCSYCYARRLYTRFKWNPEIRFDPYSFYALDGIKKPSRIFVGSTMELFGDWIKEDWLNRILGQCQLIYPQHTFIFLTKRPENLIKWSPFPDNCWVGVSATNVIMTEIGLRHLYDIKARVKFLSLEPLLAWEHGTLPISFPPHLDWVIIGQQTPVKLKTMPKLGWVEEIISAADKLKIPVFLKDNLISCVDQYDFACKDGKYRQEFPK